MSECRLIMIFFGLRFGIICYIIVYIFRVIFWNVNFTFEKLNLTCMCLVLCILNTLKVDFSLVKCLFYLVTYLILEFR